MIVLEVIGEVPIQVVILLVLPGDEIKKYICGARFDFK